MSASLVDRLGWTLVHSIWQLAAWALTFMLLLRLLQRASSHSRYLFAAVTLAAMALTLPLTFWLQPGDGEATEAAARSMPAHAVTSAELMLQPETAAATALPAARVVDRSVGSKWTAWRQRWAAWLQPWLPALVIGWLVGVGLLSVRPLAGWCAVRRLRRVGVSPVPQAVFELVQRTAQRLGVHRGVAVVQSTLVQVPAVIGWLRPLVLLPAGTLSGLTPLQLEAVLAHELAHVRRRDYLVNLLQTLVETLLFYHPAVWWVSHQMRLEREDCCDDLALLVCCDRRQYARTLLVLDEMRAFVPAAAMSAHGGSLVSRVRRIVFAERSAAHGQPGDFASLLGLAALALVAMLVDCPRPSAILAHEPVAASDSALPTAESTETAAPPADTRGDPWFWPDPYSHLGHDDVRGEGWHYVRIAADDGAGEDLKTTAQQRKALFAIFKLFEERERELGKQLREEGKVDKAAWPDRQKEVWLKARDAARPLLTDAQHHRIDQLMIQRRSYNVFRSTELQTRLELTDQQRTRILAAIDAHLQRIRDEELELGRSTQAALSRSNEQLAEYIRQLSAAKSHRGRLSHRRVWDEIHEILSQQQREQFIRLRGPMSEPARSMLPLFDAARWPPSVRVNDTL
jgi:beta-lactamase regulating signal transducer with metallopeptidase domain